MFSYVMLAGKTEGGTIEPHRVKISTLRTFASMGRLFA